MSLKEIRERVMAMAHSKDYGEVLRWESRIDELVDLQADPTTGSIFMAFAGAYLRTGQDEKAGKMWGRFADSSAAIGMFEGQIAGEPKPRNPKPETRDPKSETRNPKPET